MIELIKEAKDAMGNSLFRAALALTLILPDICAQIEYPEIYKKKGGGNAKAYKLWWDEKIGKYEDYGHGMPYMDGEAAWQLRCAVLHNGHSEISKKVKYTFNITATGDAAIGRRSVILSTPTQSEPHATESEAFQPVIKMLDEGVENICEKVWCVSNGIIKSYPDHALVHSEIRINKRI